MITSLPVVCPSAQSLYASEAWARGNVFPKGMRKAPSKYSRAASIKTSSGILLSHERHLRAVLWRGEIGNGDDAGRIADQLDQLGDDARAGDIEGGIHALWREFPDPFNKARSIGRRDGAESAQVIMVPGARGTYHGDPAVTRELDRGGSDATGRSAHQKRLAGLHSDLGKDTRCRFDDHGESARLFERQIVGLAGPGPGSQYRVLCHHVETVAEDGVSDGNVGDAFADFIHDARSLDPDA